MEIVCGLDLSLGHFGFVMLDKDSGNVIETSYMTDTKAMYHPKEYPEAFLIAKKKKGMARDIYQCQRVEYIVESIMDVIDNVDERFNADKIYVAIEDYAFAAKSNSTYQIGELGGVVKNCLWGRGIPMRYIDPLSVKLWSTNSGTAKKIDVFRAAQEHGFTGDAELLGKTVKKKSKATGLDEIDLDGAVTDICDAFILACIFRQEMLVREGTIATADLSENNRRVLLRTTKSYPVGMIDREYIVNKG